MEQRIGCVLMMKRPRRRLLSMMLLLFFFHILSCQGQILSNSKCPMIETVANFDVKEYINKTWFVQKQQVTYYLPPSSNYCVSATYRMGEKRLYGKQPILVYNYANIGSISGPSMGGTDQPPLCAYQQDAFNEPAKLAVIPCGLPPRLAGPYWVAAVGPNYEWAIIVGGQPTLSGLCSSSETLCTTPFAGEGVLSSIRPNVGQGLWFFTRAKVASAETLQQMESVAASLGICTSQMNVVQQEGCTYDGQLILT